MLKLLNSIDREQFDPVLLCIEDTGLQAEAFRKTGVQIVTTNGLRPINRARQFLALLRLLSQFRFGRFDVVMSFLPTSQPFENWLARFGCRKGGFAFGLVVNFRMGRDKDWLTRERLASRIVAVSNGVSKILLGGPQSIGKTKVIYNGIDFKRFSRNGRNVDRDKFRLPDKCFLVTCLARLAPQKRYDVLIDAASIIKEHGINIHFAIAGQDRLDGQFQFWIADRGLESTVTYLGLLEETADLLAVSDALVLTSDYEGCPNAMLEAFSMGLPVVVTRSGAEEFVVEGRTGITVSKGDSAALAEALATLNSKRAEAKRMGGNASQWVRHNCAQTKMTNAYQDLFLQLAGNSGDRTPFALTQET